MRDFIFRRAHWKAYATPEISEKRDGGRGGSSATEHRSSGCEGGNAATAGAEDGRQNASRGRGDGARAAGAGGRAAAGRGRRAAASAGPDHHCPGGSRASSQPHEGEPLLQTLLSLFLRRASQVVSVWAFRSVFCTIKMWV